MKSIVVNPNQQTLKTDFTLSGVGLHNGTYTEINVAPAPVDYGVRFKYKDTIIPATLDYITSTYYATALKKDDVTLSTVEHLLAALYAHNIDNCLITTDGLEIPILDGSSIVFSEKIMNAGIVDQDKLAEVFVMPLASLGFDESMIYTRPGDDYVISAGIDFINLQQDKTILINPGYFHHRMAAAKTFVYESSVEQLRAAGLVKGGSIYNAIILANDYVMNPEVQVYGDDLIRHKILDIIGDFSLVGKRIKGDIYIERPGHSANAYFMKRLVTIKQAQDLYLDIKL